MSFLKYWILSFVFLLLTTSCGKIYAQKKVRSNIKIDSNTLVESKRVLNQLSTDKFQKKNFFINGIDLPYRVLEPSINENDNKVPLVITFHNSSRIGTDNEKQLEPLARIWLRKEIIDNYSCFVIAPQFSSRSSIYETNKDGQLVSKPSKEVFALNKLLDEIVNIYPNIDQKRIYLVGYSMGASTALNLLSINPDRFAAVIAIAPVPDFSNLQKIDQKRIWLIHGKEDEENPFIGSLELYKKLKTNKNLVFTSFAHLNHDNIAIPFLQNDDIPKWLFER